MNHHNWTQHEERDSSRRNTTSRQGGSSSQQQGNRSNMNMMSAMPAMASAYLAPLSGFYKDFDRIVETAFRNFNFPSMFGGNAMQAFPAMQGFSSALTNPAMLFEPRIDIAATDREYTIEVEVPGISEDNIRIDVTHDGQLCICGEKRMENDKQEKDFLRVERTYGSFSRTLSLPQDVDVESIQAEFNNGLLIITAERLESYATQPRRIEVNAYRDEEEEENVADENSRSSASRSISSNRRNGSSRRNQQGSGRGGHDREMMRGSESGNREIGNRDNGSSSRQEQESGSRQDNVTSHAAATKRAS